MPRFIRQCRCVVLIAVAILVSPAIEAADRVPSTPPSIVLVTLDTTRADRLGCYGDEDALTPTLDALASKGVRFDQAQSPAPITVPAHASLMTGLAPRRHGARDNALHALPADVPTLASALQGRGYDTAAFVSSVVLDRRTGLDRGFDLYDDGVRVGRREAFNYRERAAGQTRPPTSTCTTVVAPMRTDPARTGRASPVAANARDIERNPAMSRCNLDTAHSWSVPGNGA